MVCILFCDSISIHTVYFLSIFYAVYIEFLAIFCLHFALLCLYSAYLLFTFPVYSTHNLYTFLTEHKNIKMPSVQHRTLRRQQLHYDFSMTLTWVPDGISQSSTQSSSTSKDLSHRGTKTRIPAWKKSVSSVCIQETAYFTLTSAANLKAAMHFKEGSDSCI